MTLVLVSFNVLLFVSVLALAFRAWRREPSTRVKPIWLVLVLAMLALTAGGVHRIVVQATRIGWLSWLGEDLLLAEWQVVQSLVVGTLILFAYRTVRRATVSMRNVELIAGSLLKRVSAVECDVACLTRREREVLAEIGAGMLTDQELAACLHIAESTVQSHVKSLLRKTGLRRRQDLIGLALLHETELENGVSPIKGRHFPKLGEVFHHSQV